MSRIFKLTMLSILFCTTGIINQANSQIEQGTFCIDPYIGMPGEKMRWQFTYPDADITYTGWPLSIGNRFEYLITNYIGIGFDINYSNYGYEEFVENGYYNSVTGMWEDLTYDNNYTCVRFMFRGNYHVIRTDRLNIYFAGGIGGRKINSDCYTNGVSDNTNNIIDLIPISYRIACGGRFYFTENIGAHLEFGLYGGGIAQGGVSFKF